MNYQQLPQECEERAYWHKRFNFARWLFLIMGIWAVFASVTPWSAMLALGASFGFWIFDGICDARHQMWHLRGGDRDHEL